MEYHVLHFPERSRFEIDLNGHTAYLEYELKEDGIDIVHTVVPQFLEGRGVASALMKEVLCYAHEKQLQVIPSCSFADAYIRRQK